jgi:hypothetical protein
MLDHTRNCDRVSMRVVESWGEKAVSLCERTTRRIPETRRPSGGS